MLPVVTRVSLKAAAGLLACLSVGAPRDGASQEPPASSSSDEQRELIARIEEQQTLHGVDAPELIGPLTELARFYGEHGDRALATSAARRAVSIVRASSGLKSLDQAPLIRLLIQTEEAQGNVENSWQLERELFDIAQHNPHDLGTVPLLRDLEDRRTGLLQRYRSGEKPPQIFLGCYYAGGPFQPHGSNACRNGSKGAAIFALTGEIDVYKWTAVRLILHDDLYTSGRLPELEAAVVANCRRYRSDPLDECAEEVGLVEDLGYEVGSSVPQIDALIRIADWQLVGAPWWRAFRERPGSAAPLVPGQLAPGSIPAAEEVDDCSTCDAALETYRQAYEQLQRQGVAQEAIDRIFAPRVPVLLPGFRDSPYTEPAEGSDRYIDVAFDVTKQGWPMNVEIRGASAGASRTARFDLVHKIEGSRFRPIMTNGAFAAAAPVVVRYSSW